MSQGSSHLDQDEQHRPSVDHCAAGGALPLAPVPCLGGRTVVRRATSGLRGPSEGQASPTDRGRDTWLMGRRRGAKSVGEVHPPTLLSTLCPTLPCDLVPRFSTGISLDLGICSPPRRPTEGVVEVRPEGARLLTVGG